MASAGVMRARVRPCDLDGAGVDGAKAEDGLQNLGAAAADQSRESVDFAAAKHQVDVMQAVVADVR
jgi:hypothetical protein